MTELIPKVSILLLIFARVASFFVTIPLFSYRTIPSQMKIGFALILSWMMYYTFQMEPLAIDGYYILLVLKEVIIGICLGLIVYIVFSAVQIAGSFIDFQMGFAMANIIDPQTGASSPITGQFFNFLLLLTLLTINGHHLILDGIFYSYQFLPMEKLFPAFDQENTVEYVAKLFVAVFAVAFQMAAPVIATLFLVTLALGITGKTVPQLNIFVVGFPIKIAVGFIVIIVSMGVLVQVMRDLIEMGVLAMRNLMVVLGGG